MEGVVEKPTHVISVLPERLHATSVVVKDIFKQYVEAEMMQRVDPIRRREIHKLAPRQVESLWSNAKEPQPKES